MMSVEMANANEYVNFGTDVPAGNLTKMTVMARVNVDSYGSLENGGDFIGVFVSQYVPNVGNGPGWAFGNSSDGNLTLDRTYDSDLAYPVYWQTGATLDTDQWYHIAFTHDVTVDSNAPAFYIDGALTASTEEAAPVGAAGDASAAPLYVGSIQRVTGYYTFDGKITDVRIYNHIVPTSTILDIAKGQIVDDYPVGLVFNCSFLGATTLQKFDGVALATDATILDRVGPYVGVPEGAPIGHADTLLMFGE